MNAGRPIAVRVTSQLWQIIDRTMDNTMDCAVVEGDPDGVVPAGWRVRRAGWRQICGWSPDAPGGGWPPGQDVVALVLRPADWHFIIAELDRWNAVIDPVDAEEELRLGLAARQAVSDQLP
jgi:hypothetical protein